ncbi:hypothetical protein WK78_03225 [Burkholderia cepacia]|uniref:hypothetical protein n=1 Tax=Burkholderia cepacia TaxID=292 RepID=UPI00075CFEE2|nr:hypothetical protein [Burkholderia cepacia]KVV25113.1 hypothetical protein WK78_03225 [Burkholderia cepacia]
MEIRDSIQRFHVQQSQSASRWFAIECVGSLALIAWSLRPFFSDELSKNELLVCMLALLIGIAVMVVAIATIPLTDVDRIAEDTDFPDDCLHWIASDGKVSEQAKIDIAEAISQVEVVTYKVLFDYDDKLADRARARATEEGSGYQALMAIRAGRKA